MANLTLRKAMNFFAYISIIFCAVAIALAKWIKSLAALNDIAIIIALIITAISASFYVKSKRNWVFVVSYVVAVILIAVTYII